MKLISWNTNGIRAAIKKGFIDFFKEIDADLFAVQETKMQEGQEEINLPHYYQYWDSAEKKGYSGTLVFTHKEPISVSKGLGIEKHDKEGRVVTLEYENFYFVNVYTPNSKAALERLDYRENEWDKDFREYVVSLAKKKEVIICGDLNVAHKEIDLKNPDSNHFSAGFTDEERRSFQKLLDAGFIDTFRYIHPDTVKYSWWSYRTRARERGIGWRIDYFLVTPGLKDKIIKADILDDVYGSDHCPVMLELDLDF